MPPMEWCRPDNILLLSQHHASRTTEEGEGEEGSRDGEVGVGVRALVVTVS